MNSKIGKTKIWQIYRERQKIMWKANRFLIIYVDLEKGRIMQSKKETKSNEPHILKGFFANLCPPESICNMLKGKQIQAGEVKKGRENRYKKERKGLPSSPWGLISSKFHSANPLLKISSVFFPYVVYNIIYIVCHRNSKNDSELQINLLLQIRPLFPNSSPCSRLVCKMLFLFSESM